MLKRFAIILLIAASLFYAGEVRADEYCILLDDADETVLRIWPCKEGLPNKNEIKVFKFFKVEFDDYEEYNNFVNEVTTPELEEVKDEHGTVIHWKCKNRRAVKIDSKNITGKGEKLSAQEITSKITANTFSADNN